MPKLALIVDSDSSIRTTLKHAIEVYCPGFIAVTAETCEQALAFTDGLVPDVFILDYPLYNWTCGPLIKVAKKEAKLLIITATQTPIEQIQRVTGVQTVITKPFDIEDFVALIK